MEESEARVEMAACFDLARHARGGPHTQESGPPIDAGKAEHNRLMRAVSEQPRLARQVVALRSTAFGLVQSQGDIRVSARSTDHRDEAAPRVCAVLWNRDYANAVVAEHGNYAACSSSYLCTYHLAERLMQDAAFDEPLRLYEQWYSEYFRTYCDVALAETRKRSRRSLPWTRSGRCSSTSWRSAQAILEDAADAGGGLA